MRRALKRLLPGSLVQTISAGRKHRSALGYHQHMVEIGQEIESALQADVQVVPDRISLLEHLPKGGVIAEVGVAQGDYTRRILEVSRPRKIHLIDLWASDLPEYSAKAREHVETRFAESIASGTVEVTQGCSWEVLSGLPDGYLDWVYLDAAHDYESVKRDLYAAQPKVKDGGYICGHDYVLWSNNGLSRFGVVEAVNEFCNAERYALRYLTNQRNRHLSFALERAPQAG